MKIFLVAVAVLVVAVLAESACIEKRQARLNGNSNPSTVQKCPFANVQETPCAQSRSPCSQRNCGNIERTPCEILEAENRETQQSSKTDTNSANNVNVHSNSANANPVENKVQVNLINTVNNINNISNPIEITNVNHFFYNGSVSSTKNCQNGGRCRQEIEQIQNRPTGCQNSQIRPPIVLPPYIPPPPPCFRMQQFPYIGCQQQPAPYVTSSKYFAIFLSSFVKQLLFRLCFLFLLRRTIQSWFL